MGKNTLENAYKDKIDSIQRQYFPKLHIIMKPLIDKIRYIKRKFLFSKIERKLVYRISHQLHMNKDKNTSKKILVDIPDDAVEIIEQIATAKFFSIKNRCHVDYYNPSVSYSATSGRWRYFDRLARERTRGIRVAQRCGITHGLDHKYISKHILELSVNKAEEFIKTIHSKSDIIDYKLDNVSIGTSIYDTFLRKYNEPTIDIEDRRLLEIAIEAHIILYIIKRYFTENEVDMVLIGHCVYNNWKILSDYAISKNVQVFVTYNSPRPPLHDVNRNRGLQTKDHTAYKQIFEKFSAEDKIIHRNEGVNLLEKRMSGFIDSGLSYMRESSYKQGSSLKDIYNKRKDNFFVIMLHSFFDSPHVYNSMVFCDFYDWIMETLEYIESKKLYTQYDILIKPHPNRLPGEDEIIDRINARFPFIVKLSGSENNNDIINAGPSFIISVYGTVSAEFTYRGIPVILCGDNPTSSFSFCFEAKDKNDYFKKIMDGDKLKVTDSMIDEVGAFTYMHYIHQYFGAPDGWNFKRSMRGHGEEMRLHESLEGFSFKKFSTGMDRYLSRGDGNR